MAGCGKVGSAVMAKERNEKAKPAKKKGMALSDKKNMAGYIFVLPVIIGLVFIFLPSLIKSFVYAFNTVTINFGSVDTEFTGLTNFYDAFFTDAEFLPLLISALRGMFFDSVVIILFSFFMSNVLNQKFVGRGICRVIFFLPVVLSMGIVADMESANDMYNAMSAMDEASGGGFDQLGLSTLFSVGRLLTVMGLPASMTNIIASILSNMYGILNSSGVQILIFLSALQAISPSVFEAAKMEGATKWEEFWKITFPMLTPSLLVCVVYTVISTFTNPIYGVMEYIESKGFTGGQLGYASAISWIYFIIVIVVLGIASIIISKRVTYLD